MRNDFLFSSQMDTVEFLQEDKEKILHSMHEKRGASMDMKEEFALVPLMELMKWMQKPNRVHMDFDLVKEEDEYAWAAEGKIWWMIFSDLRDKLKALDHTDSEVTAGDILEMIDDIEVQVCRKILKDESWNKRWQKSFCSSFSSLTNTATTQTLTTRPL